MAQRRPSFLTKDSDWLIPAVLAAVHLILAGLAFHTGPFEGGDDATYLALARSLVEHGSYTEVWDPAMAPHTMYPPVFPAIIAGALGLGISAGFGLKVMMLLFSAAAVFASSALLSRLATPGVALAGGIFIAVSPELLRVGHEVLSDVPFWLFTCVALMAWARGGDEADARSGVSRISPRWVALATAATLLAYFTRSAGLPLVAAAFIWLTWRRDWRAAGILAGAAVPLAFAWWLRGHYAGAGGYLLPFISVDPYNPALGHVSLADIAGRFAENVDRYATRHLPRTITGTLVNGEVIGPVVGIAVMAGWIRRLRKPSLTEVFFPTYLGLVLLWPVTWSGSRLLFPVLPLIALYSVEPVAALVRRSSRPVLAGAALTIAAVAWIAPEVSHRVNNGSRCRAEQAGGNRYPCTSDPFREFLEVARVSREKLPAGSVVLSRKPTIFFVHSGHRGGVYPYFPAPDSLFGAARRIGADYVVMDRMSVLSERYVRPAIEQRPSAFCEVPGVRSGKTRVLRFGQNSSLPICTR